MEEHEEWEPLWSARGSPATSSAGSLEVADELDEQQSPPAGGRSMVVFVAVPEEVSDGRSTLLWALHNLVRDGSKVVIAHVHSPAQRKHFLSFFFLGGTGSCKSITTSAQLCITC